MCENGRCILLGLFLPSLVFFTDTFLQQLHWIFSGFTSLPATWVPLQTVWIVNGKPDEKLTGALFMLHWEIILNISVKCNT